MVVGIEKFREKLGAYSESYIIIGGTACDLILIGGMRGIFNF